MQFAVFPHIGDIGAAIRVIRFGPRGVCTKPWKYVGWLDPLDGCLTVCLLAVKRNLNCAGNFEKCEKI
jgi:hypothetical protein